VLISIEAPDIALSRYSNSPQRVWNIEVNSCRALGSTSWGLNVTNEAYFHFAFSFWLM